MQQFQDALYMTDLGSDSKFNMSYRLKVLLNEQLDLANYGEAVQNILFSPIIGDVFPPKSTYSPRYKKLSVEFYMNSEEAVLATEAEFFQQMINGLLTALQTMKLPKDFNLTQFEKDVQGLSFEQVPEVV